MNYTHHRAQIEEHAAILVEERLPCINGVNEGLYLVQRTDRRFAVVRYGWDIDPMAPTAKEVLDRARWFDRDLIAGALVSANVRPLIDPDRMLSFLGACAVSLGLVENEETDLIKRQLNATQAMYQEAIRHLERMTPKRKHAAQARGFLRATSGAERRGDS